MPTIQVQTFPIWQETAINTFLADIKPDAVHSIGVHDIVTGSNRTVETKMVIIYEAELAAETPEPKIKIEGLDNFFATIAETSAKLKGLTSLHSARAAMAITTKSYDRLQAEAHACGVDASEWNRFEELADAGAMTGPGMHIDYMEFLVMLTKRYGKEYILNFKGTIQELGADAMQRTLEDLIGRHKL